MGEYHMSYPILTSKDWSVIGVERSLTSAYEIATTENISNSRYSQLTNGRTEAQIESLTSTADFLKKFIASESEEDKPSGVVFRQSDGKVFAFDENGDMVPYIHYPEIWEHMRYISDDGLEWHVLCGKINESNGWTIETYARELRGHLKYVLSGDVNDIGETPFEVRMSLLFRKFINGHEDSEVPYIMLKEESRERWTIVDKNGDYITGVAYDSIEEAASVIMRIYDYCGNNDFEMALNHADEPKNTSVCGLAVCGRAKPSVAHT